MGQLCVSAMRHENSSLWLVCDRSVEATVVFDPLTPCDSCLTHSIFESVQQNYRVWKINERRSSLVRSHHAVIVFSSSLRPTKINQKEHIQEIEVGVVPLPNNCWMLWRIELEASRSRGGPKLRWRDRLKYDMMQNKIGLRPEWASERESWFDMTPNGNPTQDTTEIKVRKGEQKTHINVLHE